MTDCEELGVMSSITDGSPSEMNDFKCQLSGLLATLQKLPCGEQQAALDLLQLTVKHQFHVIQHAGNNEVLSLSEKCSAQDHHSSHQETRNVEMQCDLQVETIGEGTLQASQAEDLEEKTLHVAHQQTLNQESEPGLDLQPPSQEKLSLDILHQFSETRPLDKKQEINTINLPQQKVLDPVKVQGSQQYTVNIRTIDGTEEHTVDLGTAQSSQQSIFNLKEAHCPEENNIDVRISLDLQENTSFLKTVNKCQQHITNEEMVCSIQQNVTGLVMNSEDQHHMTDHGKYDETLQVSTLDRIHESQDQAVPLLSHVETPELSLVNPDELDDAHQEVRELGALIKSQDGNKSIVTLQEPSCPQGFQGEVTLITDEAHPRNIHGKQERNENKHSPCNRNVSFDETSSSSFNVPNFSHMPDRDNLYHEDSPYMLPYLERTNCERIDFKLENVATANSQDDLQKSLEMPYSSDNFLECSKENKDQSNESDLEKGAVHLSSAFDVHTSIKDRSNSIDKLDELDDGSVYPSDMKSMSGEFISAAKESCDQSRRTSQKMQTSEHRINCKRKCQNRIPSDFQRHVKSKRNNQIMTPERINSSTVEGTCEHIFGDDVFEANSSSDKKRCKYEQSVPKILLTLSPQNFSENLTNSVDSVEDKCDDVCASEQIALFESNHHAVMITEPSQERGECEASLSPNLRPVCCRSCKKELPDVSLLSVHLRQCEGHLTCTFCQTKFIHKVTFSRHMEGHKRNVCSKCSQSFCSHKKLKAHMKAEHNFDLVSKTYPCHKCSRSFLKRSSLYYHFKVHASENEHVCQKCGVFCKGSEHYKLHMADHLKSTNFHCHICTASFKRRQQYDDHLKHHKKNKCEICEQPFTTKRALVRHCRIEHNTLPQNIIVDPKYKCDKCDRVFNRPSILRHHLQLHGGVKPLECRVCNKQFSHKRGLRKHLNSVVHEHMLLTNNLQKDHAYDIKQNFAFICEYCGIKLPTRHMLSKHSRLAHKVGITWSCPHCDYKTKRNHTLKRHMELHLESRNFMCEICGNSFQALATLKDHHNFVHSDERNYKCSECSKSFKNKSSLARHCRTHSDDRPYQCHCGTSYKRLSHLKRHMSSAHNEILKSRAVKKFKQTQETDTSLERSFDGKDSTQSTEFSDGEEFEFVSMSSSSLSPVLQTEASVKDTNDILLPTQESIILMGENSNSEQSHLITVGDSQIIQLIPSTLQFPQESSFQAVSLVSTSELHTLPISSSAPYGHVAQSSHVVVEPFSLSQNSETMVMVPASQEDHAHLSDSDVIRTNLRTIENEALNNSSRIGRDTAKRVVKQEMNVHTLENHTELSVTTNLDTFDYRAPPSSQPLLPALPPAHYITHTQTSNTQLNQDLIQPNLICSDFVLPVDDGR